LQQRGVLVEIGQLLGVEELITGSLGKVGSMFLVNCESSMSRREDNQVVSKDVKGSIEDVVGELSSIAAELVGLSGAPAVVEKKPEENPLRQEQPNRKSPRNRRRRKKRNNRPSRAQ